MRSRGIWLTMLMRGVQLNSLTALNAGTTAPISYTQCYGTGGGIDIARKDTSPQRGGTWEYDHTKYQPPLYHNGSQIGEGCLQ